VLPVTEVIGGHQAKPNMPNATEKFLGRRFAPVLAEQRKVWAMVNRFSIYARSTRKQIALALLLTLLLPLLATLMYSLAQKLVDNIFTEQAQNYLPALAAAVVAVGLTRLLLEYFDQCLDARIAEQISQEARVGLYARLVGATPDVVQKRGVGALLAHLDQDSSRIASLVYSVPVGVYAHVVKALCFLVFLLSISWKLTLIAVMVMPLLGWIVYSLTPLVRRSARIARNRSTAWLLQAEERLAALPLIYVSEAQGFETAHFNRLVDGSRRAEIRALTMEARLSLAINLATGSGTGLVLLAGVYQVQAHALTVGAVLAFVAALGSLYDPLRGVTQGAGRWQRALASAERLDKLINENSIQQPAASCKEPGIGKGQIEFKNIVFAYAEGQTVLDGVSLSIQAGERIALVGASGSGKSTLLRLLAGLHSAQSGQVLIDGHDIRHISQVQLHAAMAVAFQEPYLFRGTIAENIRYNLAAVDSQQVLRAATTAQVDGFAYSLQHSLGSPVGSRGAKLSGGQRQRVSLARALLRHAPILLLDEATSALDSETEEWIYAALRSDKQLGTTITVSHRLSSVRAADRIIVLDQGRIVETGTPDELLCSRSRCYELFAAQIAAERPGAIPLFPLAESGPKLCISA
jgi:ABC-type multidrug transport system fused ATPase/permease subunit